MEPKPVAHSRPPAYPTRREGLAGTASFALVSLTGCSFVDAEAQIDEKRSIAIAFICRKNYGTLGGLDSQTVEFVDRDGNFRGGRLSTVSDYDFRDAAQYVATEIRQKARQRLYVGVFYDPSTRAKWERGTEPSKTPADRRSSRDEASAESKKLLRQQVQDFVAWLKQEGAISPASNSRRPGRRVRGALATLCQASM